MNGINKNAEAEARKNSYFEKLEIFFKLFKDFKSTVFTLLIIVGFLVLFYYLYFQIQFFPRGLSLGDSLLFIFLALAFGLISLVVIFQVIYLIWPLCEFLSNHTKKNQQTCEEEINTRDEEHQKNLDFKTHDEDICITFIKHNICRIKSCLSFQSILDCIKNIKHSICRIKICLNFQPIIGCIKNLISLCKDKKNENNSTINFIFLSCDGLVALIATIFYIIIHCLLSDKTHFLDLIGVILASFMVLRAAIHGIKNSILFKKNKYEYYIFFVFWFLILILYLLILSVAEQRMAFWSGVGLLILLSACISILLLAFSEYKQDLKNKKTSLSYSPIIFGIFLLCFLLPSLIITKFTNKNITHLIFGGVGIRHENVDLALNTEANNKINGIFKSINGSIIGTCQPHLSHFSHN